MPPCAHSAGLCRPGTRDLWRVAAHLDRSASPAGSPIGVNGGSRAPERDVSLGPVSRPSAASSRSSLHCQFLTLYHLGSERLRKDDRPLSPPWRAGHWRVVRVIPGGTYYGSYCSGAVAAGCDWGGWGAAAATTHPIAIRRQLIMRPTARQAALGTRSTEVVETVRRVG